MPRPVHFEINADEPARAAEFYSGVFGWKISKWDGPIDYWLVDTGEGDSGINGGIVPRMQPNLTTVNTITVDDLDSYLAKVQKAGGKIMRPKSMVPGIGWLAYVTDTDGNPFGMLQPNDGA
jgi:predicted enzyme related to lactoylglutathione lyase